MVLTHQKSPRSALAFSFSRCVPAVPSGRAFFAALPPQLALRLERGEVSPQEAPEGTGGFNGHMNDIVRSPIEYYYSSYMGLLYVIVV